MHELLSVIILPAALSIIKILGNSIFYSLETKENHLTHISTRNDSLKGANSNQTSVMVQKDNFPNDNSEILAR